MPVEESPHHSPTLRRLEGCKSQVGMLDGEQSEDVLVSRERVGGRVGVLERVEVGNDLRAELLRAMLLKIVSRSLLACKGTNGSRSTGLTSAH